MSVSTSIHSGQVNSKMCIGLNATHQSSISGSESHLIAFLRSLPLASNALKVLLPVLCILIAVGSQAATKNTAVAGNWNTAGNWSSSGVPASTDIVNVNHSMVVNTNLSISSAAAYYTFNANTTAGGTGNISISNGTLDIRADVTLAGSGTFSGGTIYIRPGYTLTLTGNVLFDGTTVIIEDGGTLIVTGDLDNKGDIEDDGTLTVTGKYKGYNGSSVSGNGNFISGETLLTAGSGALVFGSNGNCNSGPCDGNSLCTGTPVSAISGPTAVCVGSSITLTNSTAGGVWSSGNTARATVSASGVVTGVSAGTVVISYKVTGSSCNTTKSQTITVSGSVPSAAGTITGSASACSNTSGLVFSIPAVSGASSYTWTVPSGATITGGTGTNSITVKMGPSPGNVTVTPTNGCGSGASSSKTVSGPTAQTITGNAAICVGATTTYSSTSPSGTWSSATPSVATVHVSSGLVTGASAGTSVITYTVNVSGCSNTATKTITVSSPVTQTITGAATLCVGSSVSYTSTTAGGTWSSSIPANAVVNASNGLVTAMAAGTSSISYSVTTTGGCVNTISKTITTSLCVRTWTGATSTAWSVASNWSPASVPTLSDSVVIPNVTRKPVITGSVNAGGVLINSGSSITLSPGSTLNVYGKVLNNGTFTTVATSTLSFNGATAQTVSGISGVNNMTVNNASGVSVLSPMTISGTLKLPSGALTTGNQLQLNIDNGGNIGYTSGDAGSVSGTLTVLRAVSSIKTHYISCPVNGAKVSDLADDAEVINPSTNKTRLFTSNFATQGWTAVNDLNTSFVPGNAYSMYFPTATTVDFTGSYTHGSVYSSGSYANAAVNYIFMGNPYPSTLDWSNAAGWTKTKIKDAIYYWNPVTAGYASYVNGVSVNGGTQYVPAMNSFFVATDGTGGSSSIAINNNARNSSQNPSMWRTDADQTVRISLKGSQYTDEAVVRFNENATAEFDNNLDAYKFMNTGSSPSVYTSVGQVNYSINSLSGAEAYPQIPVGMKLPADDAYTITVTNSDASLVYVLLDKVLGTETVINGSGTYSFTGLKTDPSARFELQLRTGLTTDLKDMQEMSALQMYSSTNGFNVYTEKYAGKTVDIEIMDITGRTVRVLKSVPLENGNTFIPMENMQSGSYLIKIGVESVSFVDKVSLMR